MNKTKIEWTDYTWNPIKGLCPVGCWYCYARRIYKRFHLDEGLEFHVTRGEIAKMARLPPSRIFICSTMEMFHPAVKEEWRDKIFCTIGQFPKHTFIILTKMPERIDRPMPSNVWLGVSVSRREDQWRIDKLHEASAWTRLISFEPLFGDDVAVPNGLLFGIDWVIVGRLTGRGKKLDPPRLAVESIVKAARHWDTSVFLKNNLASIWGKPLIQEWPR